MYAVVDTSDFRVIATSETKPNRAKGHLLVKVDQAGLFQLKNIFARDFKTVTRVVKWTTGHLTNSEVEHLSNLVKSSNWSEAFRFHNLKGLSDFNYCCEGQVNQFLINYKSNFQ